MADQLEIGPSDLRASSGVFISDAPV